VGLILSRIQNLFSDAMCSLHHLLLSNFAVIWREGRGPKWMLLHCSDTLFALEPLEMFCHHALEALWNPGPLGLGQKMFLEQLRDLWSILLGHLASITPQSNQQRELSKYVMEGTGPV
jgi:hypothetical protein